MATASGISLCSVYGITLFQKSLPFEKKICEEVTKDDFDSRVQLCKQMDY